MEHNAMVEPPGPGNSMDYEDVQPPVQSMDVDVFETPPKQKRYCSAFGCLTKSPNSSDIHMHRVKVDWLQAIPWKRAKPVYVCDLILTFFLKFMKILTFIILYISWNKVIIQK